MNDDDGLPKGHQLTMFYSDESPDVPRVGYYCQHANKFVDTDSQESFDRCRVIKFIREKEDREEFIKAFGVYFFNDLKKKNKL